MTDDRFVGDVPGVPVSHVRAPMVRSPPRQQKRGRSAAKPTWRPGESRVRASAVGQRARMHGDLLAGIGALARAIGHRFGGGRRMARGQRGKNRPIGRRLRRGPLRYVWESRPRVAPQILGGGCMLALKVDMAAEPVTTLPKQAHEMAFFITL